MEKSLLIQQALYSPIHVRVWKLSSEMYQPDCVSPTKLQRGFKIVVCGIFSFDGIGPLELLHGNMNSKTHIDILETHVTGLMVYHPRYMYQQDNASAHTAKEVMVWMKDRDLQLLPWSTKSSDLSPIKSLWAIVKTRMRKRGCRAKSQQELFEMFHLEWLNMSKTMCEELAMSLPSHLRACIKASGGPTKH